MINLERRIERLEERLMPEDENEEIVITIVDPRQRREPDGSDGSTKDADSYEIRFGASKMKPHRTGEANAQATE